MSVPPNPFEALADVMKIPNEEAIKTDRIETIFEFTLNERRKHLVFLSDVKDTFQTTEINLEILEHALCERLLMQTGDSGNDVMKYLTWCYRKADFLEDEFFRTIKNIIVQNVVTALREPDLYADEDTLYAQLFTVLSGCDPADGAFLLDVYNKFVEEVGLSEASKPFKGLLKSIHIEVARSSLVTFHSSTVNILEIFATNEALALILLDYCQPKNWDRGIEYSNTLLGALLSISVLPKTTSGKFEYFEDPRNEVGNSATENLIWVNTRIVSKDIYNVVFKLLKCSTNTKTQLLSWFGKCLKANIDRGKLWNAQELNFNPLNLTNVSDGFMLNLCTLFTQLCKPFYVNLQDEKILKIDPTYCAIKDEDAVTKGVHMLDLSNETCLVPASESDGEVAVERLAASQYNFMTEMFFMAHRTFDLSFRIIADKLVRLNQDLVRMERAYQETLRQSARSSDVADTIQQRLSMQLTRFLSFKCSLCETDFLSDLFNFISASCSWLIQVAINKNYNSTTTYCPSKFRVLKFPLDDDAPDTLKCIPEFIIENIVCFLIFLRRFKPQAFEEGGYDRLSPILTFIIIYMGSSRFARNPHLRAHLAEALEALLPYHKDDNPMHKSLSTYERQHLFKDHEHRKEIVESLLNVFVGIEMTGESVQFEQKFNYRRPMYLVMNYLWECDEYRNYFSELAEIAEENMEINSAPLFLRFVNLLMNDSVFLLDESLSNMSQLRNLELLRERGEWDNLPARERAQNMENMQHIGMMARFDNILGRDTIHMLDLLTSHIKIVFTHRQVVSRVAEMLNYFLKKLVGPDQKDFKVKDQKEYSFNPAAIVLDICKIYVNLKESDAFCLAISQDTRSYRPELFTLAEDVLIRINGGVLIGYLQEVANRVAQLAADCQSNEEIIAEAPEHFLDPIMQTLMRDPVILPSSKQTVDRSTIARHLLSDQTDPFNRVPLSMDQVIPNTALLEEIAKWLDERKIR